MITVAFPPLTRPCPSATSSFPRYIRILTAPLTPDPRLIVIVQRMCLAASRLHATLAFVPDGLPLPAEPGDGGEPWADSATALPCPRAMPDASFARPSREAVAVADAGCTSPAIARQLINIDKARLTSSLLPI